MGTDVFWRSNAIRGGISSLIAVGFAGLLAVMTWNIGRTSEIETDSKLNKQRLDAVTEELKEIKSDVKTLLRRIP